MSKAKIYHNKEGTSNKFWSYEVQGNNVLVRFGRVGLEGQQKLHEFGSPFSRDAFINKIVAEKEKKGYQEVAKDKLEQEKSLAESLGYRSKIEELKFVTVDGKNDDTVTITELDEPDYEYILVKTIDSWNKDADQGAKYYLISQKHGHLQLTPTSKSGKYRYGTLHDHRIGPAIIEYLKDQIVKITKIVTAQFASFQGRILDDSDVTVVVAAYKASGKADAGISDQVLGKLATMTGFASFAGRVIDF